MRWTLTILLAVLAGQAPLRWDARYILYREARPVLEAVESGLPSESDDTEKGADTEARWARWARARDAEIRNRLERGEEDSLINWLLFGVTFTDQPRFTAQYLQDLASSQGTRGEQEAADVLVSRTADLVAALARPGTDERRLFAGDLLRRKGLDPGNPAHQARIRANFVDNLRRLFEEQEKYKRLLEDARSLGSPTEEFAARSTLYRDRGLSLDTSILPNFAIEDSLEVLKKRGLLKAGSVRRAGVIGPGLDFADKDAGYDVFPQQTLQPFALMDTLLRLGLAQADDLEVVTLDISPRVNDHLRRARERARRGQGYTIQLLRPEEPWHPEMAGYWKRFGECIGAGARPVPRGPVASKLSTRAIRVSPQWVLRVHPVEANIVLQRLEPGSSGFDLVVATNVLVYYDTLEQSLALANIAAMLRPGGLLLSNNAVLELPEIPMRSAGYRTTVYSDRPDHGDHVVWYQKTPGTMP